LVGKLEGKRTTRKTNDIGEWIILRWILREIDWGDVKWIGLAQDKDKRTALVDAVINIPVP
jgi:hypothetical protein